jgi:hypothetical protein
MVGTLSDTIAGIVGIVIVLFATAGIVVLLNGSFTRKENPLEVDFRAACSQANGKAVWNGRHWECLK